LTVLRGKLMDHAREKRRVRRGQAGRFFQKTRRRVFPIKWALCGSVLRESEKRRTRGIRPSRHRTSGRHKKAEGKKTVLLVREERLGEVPLD